MKRETPDRIIIRDNEGNRIEIGYVGRWYAKYSCNYYTISVNLAATDLETAKQIGIEKLRQCMEENQAVFDKLAEEL